MTRFLKSISLYFKRSPWLAVLGTIALFIFYYSIQQILWCRTHVCTGPFEWWHSASLSEEAQAAWAQAWGTVLAFVAAVAVPAALLAKDAQEKRQRMQRRARALALKSLPSIRRYRRGLRTALTNWSKTMTTEQRHLFLLGFTAEFAVDLPQDLVSLIDDAVEAGSPAFGLQQMLYAARSLKLDMEFAQRLAMSSKPSDLTRAQSIEPKLRHRTDRLLVSAGDTYKDLRNLFKSVDEDEE